MPDEAKLNEKEEALRKRLETLKHMEQEILEKEKAMKLREKKQEAACPASFPFALGRNRPLGGRGFPFHQQSDRVSSDRMCQTAEKENLSVLPKKCSVLGYNR